MFCSKCGTQNADGASFCLSCGAPMAAGVQAPAYQAQQQWGQPAARRAPAAEGNIGAAWRDITGSEGWFKKILLLLLIGCVPILNFAVEGYGIRWARELSFGQRAGLPDTFFKKKEISTGFFAWLVRIGLSAAFFIVVFVITLLLSGLFGIFNPLAASVVSTILTVVFAVFEVFFFNPVVDASVLRMSVVGYLESGFNFGVAWRAFRRNMGSLIGASIVPRLVVGIVEAIVVGLVFGLGVLIAGGAIMNVVQGTLGSSLYGLGSGYASGYGSAMSALPFAGLYSTIMGLGAGIVLFFVVIWLLGSMFNVFSTLFAYRAIGHWVARTAPEWASETEDGLDSANAGGFGFNSIIPDAPVQPPMQYGNAAGAQAVPAMPTQRQQWNGPIDKGDSGTTRLDEGGPKFALIRKSNGRTYDITAFPATVGKGSAATVRIEDNNAISRTHVRIAYTGSSFVVEELGATNKTYLNGDYLSDGEVVILKDGDELKLAEEAFTVQIR